MAVSSMALLKSKEYNFRHDTIVGKLTCPDKSKCATKITNILRKRQKREQCLNLINAPSFPCIRLRRCGQFFISDSHVFIHLFLWVPLLKLLPTSLVKLPKNDKSFD